MMTEPSLQTRPKSTRRGVFCSARWLPTLSVIVISAALGCGSELRTVDPPEMSTSQSQAGEPTGEATDAASSDPPGGMELPENVNPPGGSETRPAPTPKSGFEMPGDLDSTGDLDATSDLDSTGGQSSATDSDRPNVQFASWSEIQSMAATPGQITVLDLWSLSCEPCKKEFPQLVKLHQQYGQSVRCVAVNLDFDGRRTRPPVHYQEPVRDFLAGVGASGFPSYICDTPSDDVYAAADIDSIPTVMIFDADGKLVKAFVDAGETLGFTYEKDIFPLIEKMAG